MNYETASDKDLMIELTAKLYECEQWCLNGDESEFYHCGIDGNQYYSYPVLKMTWADIGPVIEDIWDDLVWCTDYEEVYWEEVIREYECSKLRAAVIVAIQVLEQRVEETV